MDQDRFDRIARALGAGATRRAGLRAALGGLLGAGMGISATTADADAKRRRAGDADAGKKRRKTCKPACTNGYECVKVGKKRECVCATGVGCGDACCRIGQVCDGGACVPEPEPGQCIAAGERCKGVGLPCCGGRTCSSGQGGFGDIACYVHKTGTCQSTADCVYGTACIDGRCGFDVPPPAATGAPCNLTVGQQCADPDAVCTPYDGPDAPDSGGAFCTLPLDVTCTGDPDCTCYRCWYPNGTLAPTSPAGSSARAPQTPDPVARLACCGPEGYACQSDKNCCLGTTCVNGACQAVCDVCASGCPYMTIKDAYVGMPAGSTIRIAPGEYGGPENFIDSRGKSMTFVPCGDGTVTWARSQGNKNLILQANSASPDTQLAFVGIDFVRGADVGSSDEFLKLSGSDGTNRTTVVACRFAGNSGQAIDIGSNPNELFVYDSLFEDNVAGDAGAAIYAGAGRLTVERTVFRNNTSTSDKGGGAIFKNDTQPMLIVDSVCENNQATGSRKGGCISLDGGTSTLRNVQMRGNHGNDGGGAISINTTIPSLRFEGTTTATGNSIKVDQWVWGSGIFCYQSSGTSCASRITGTTNANISNNTPADKTCSVRMPDNFYSVDCATWCLPAGAQVLSRDNDCALCCNGCVSGSGDPATCA